MFWDTILKEMCISLKEKSHSKDHLRQNEAEGHISPRSTLFAKTKKIFRERTRNVTNT